MGGIIDYPNEFKAEFQIIKHVDKSMLLIQGIHDNPNIGNYKVEIIPHGKSKLTV